jgi:hypothetical protein
MVGRSELVCYPPLGRHPRAGASQGVCRVGQVFGFGPFRADSSVCKAAFFAGVIGEDGGVATLTFGGRVSSREAGKAVLADAVGTTLCRVYGERYDVHAMALRTKTGLLFLGLCTSPMASHDGPFRGPGVQLNLVCLFYHVVM